MAQTESVKVQIDGAIINELTENISSNHVAIVELIKNAYDADASNVKITFDTKKETLIVEDDGNGMKGEHIQSLLHIAKSNKQYGKARKNGRITQGEKGLGALSAFKFGSKVTWETVADDNIKRTLSLDKEKLVLVEDLGNYEVKINSIPDNVSNRGTTITIQVSPNDIEYYSEVFSDSKVLNKIVNNFIVIQKDSNIKDMDIVFNINGKQFQKQKISDFRSIATQRQIFEIKYNSELENLTFYKNGVELFSEKYPKPSSEYTCVAEFVAYDLTGGRPKEFDDDTNTLHLALNSRAITPLLYINQSFLSNYQYFNPDDSRRSKSGKSLPQLTGYIDIRCDSKELIYNPDRSGLIENRLTKSIIDFLHDFNVKLQEIGAANKKFFVPGYNLSSLVKQQELNMYNIKENQRNNLFVENILQDYREKYPFKISDSKVFVEYGFFGNKLKVPLQCVDDSEEPSPPTGPDKTDGSQVLGSAMIILYQSRIEKTIGSPGQIDLWNCIVAEKTLDSEGNEIPFEKITIVDNENLMKSKNILPSVTSPTTLIVTYNYHDKKTGNTSTDLVVDFKVAPQKPMILW